MVKAHCFQFPNTILEQVRAVTNKYYSLEQHGTTFLVLSNCSSTSITEHTILILKALNILKKCYKMERIEFCKVYNFFKK